MDVDTRRYAVLDKESDKLGKTHECIRSEGKNRVERDISIRADAERENLAQKALRRHRNANSMSSENTPGWISLKMLEDKSLGKCGHWMMRCGARETPTW